MIKIFLIGFMGSGKSFVGKRLAEGMNLPFYDLDEYLEVKEGRTISQIFAEDGEAYFREIEGKYLRDFARISNAVIACGGGTPCFYENMDWMNEQGITIYLDTPEEILLQRLQKETSQRPLLAQFSRQELAAYLKEKIAERSSFYNQASIIYHVQAKNENVVKNLLRHLSHTGWNIKTGKN